MFDVPIVITADTGNEFYDNSSKYMAKIKYCNI